jgi:pimeloyl-ACP methyl ester carboxylesterase
MPTVSANGLEFAYLEAGAGKGKPLALCLHGFPDAAPTWNPLLAALADAGFHAVAPWMRGYAPTQVPSDGLYGVGALERDANALHDALGGDDRAVLIGHDWGAMATYGAAITGPDKWRRVVTMAVPPSGALGMGFLSFAQLKRSWYMFFFQNPLAEMAAGMDDLAFVEGFWRDWSPGFDGSAHIPAVKDALRDPANLTAAIGYYRALIGGSDAPATAGTPPQPVLYLHGRDDGCVGAELADNAALFLSAESRVEVLEGCGHFLQVEQPDLVNKLVLDWVAT